MCFFLLPELRQRLLAEALRNTDNCILLELHAFNWDIAKLPWKS